VLNQRSTILHIQYLQATADPEKRHISLERLGDQPQLNLISFVIGLVSLRAGTRSVTPWVYVRATHED
jgi:hypothetical protein